jgi:hypothetical protein
MHDGREFSYGTYVYWQTGWYKLRNGRTNTQWPHNCDLPSTAAHRLTPAAMAYAMDETAHAMDATDSDTAVNQCSPLITFFSFLCASLMVNKKFNSLVIFTFKKCLSEWVISCSCVISLNLYHSALCHFVSPCPQHIVVDARAWSCQRIWPWYVMCVTNGGTVPAKLEYQYFSTNI